MSHDSDQPIRSSDTLTSHTEPMDSLVTSHSTTRGPITFDVMAAMCHGNRGIGYECGLPWPSLKRDYEYYSSYTSALRNVTSVDKKIVHIRGRVCWLCCKEKERSLLNVYHVIISTTWTISDCEHPRMLKVVPTFANALEFISSPDMVNDVDSVWVMGGAMVYKDALLHPQCNLLYLTHVYTDFLSDTFFPVVGQDFKEVEDQPEMGVVHEENGVKFEFKIYKKSTDV